MPATAEARRLTATAASGRGWALLAIALCIPTLIPLGSALASLLRPDVALVAHLWQYILPEVAANTVWLMLGTGIGTVIIGTGLAALVALCEFPGRRFFSWALVLPLAMPAYVMAVAVIGLFDYGGNLAAGLRELGIQLPDIRSRWGVTAVMTLSLYPYVYLLARGAFATQGARALESARSLGFSPGQAFWRASLPLARPWIGGGLLLVLMETLADFGTVSAFNYDTFTAAIYKSWYALFSVDAALQIAAVLLLLVLALVLIEAWTRRRQSFSQLGVAARPLVLKRYRWLAFAACALVFAAAFLVPVGRLLWSAAGHLAEIDSRYLNLAANAASLAAMAAGLTVLWALLVAMASREHPRAVTRTAVRIATLGYGLPGALLAVGLYVPLVRASGWLSEATGFDLALESGLLILLTAYMVRFTAVAYAPIGTGLLRIRPSLVEASRSLGVRSWRLWGQVHLPLLRQSMITAALLVFVDVMKEMPITLMTRPFGWDTLATRVFELTNEGEWSRAGVPAMAIVLVGLLPVMLLDRSLRRAP